MNYWLDLFTGTTWEEFRKAGANISGFSERKRKGAELVKPGDVFLCYLTRRHALGRRPGSRWAEQGCESHLGSRRISCSVRSEAARHARS